MKNNIIYLMLALFLSALMGGGTLTSCQKMERPELIIIPDDTARLNGPLQRYFAFENSVIDSIHDVKGTATGITYVDGVRNKAIKGSATGQVEYASAGKMADMESFTVAFWMNTEKHKGGAQSVFMLSNTDDFWGNMFLMLEGNESPTDNSMLAKFNFAGQWIEFNGNNGLNRLPDMYGKWHHLACSYDGKTSKFSAYLDGAKLNLPASATDRKNGTAPLGPLKFKNVSKFVIGGFQQHVGIKPPADEWMLHYTGMLDQFRVYTKALTDNEINALYTGKK
ncbi:MAG: Concanavalin A-like lectin/glucanase superfamily protein [Adhaeribacter sp.]|nr:Concanavalin A-like lectin/glucanase superfamily protein [Adhaeribacter sp.]